MIHKKILVYGEQNIPANIPRQTNLSVDHVKGVKSDVQGLFDREYDILNLRYTMIFQNFSVGHWYVHTSYSGNRSIQIIESRTWK